MKVITLGTSGTIPTLFRNLPSVVLQREGEIFLFDCGEGTQIQIVKSGLGFGRIKGIFISHLHGDHVTGLPGLLMTLAQSGRKEPLQILGPKGLKRFIETIKSCLGFFGEYEILVNEIEEGIVYKGDGYWIESSRVDHNTFTLGYALIEEERSGKFMLKKVLSLGVQEGPLFRELQLGRDITLKDGRVVRSKDVLGPKRPGRKVAYAIDTRPCQKVIDLAKDADLLIHDGMFSDELEEDAHLKGHSTHSQAARIAKEASVKKLVLTHISSRYRNIANADLLKNAKEIFPNIVIAHDLMKFEIPVHKSV
ncbi:MAG: ribonuclease Z [bacterium]|nr:ribonuclease Z [bacterium]